MVVPKEEVFMLTGKIFLHLYLWVHVSFNVKSWSRSLGQGNRSCGIDADMK